jgi:hypothetical protein
MRSAWQEFTIEDLSSYEMRSATPSREGWLDVVGEELLVELSSALGARIATSPVRNPHEAPGEQM